MLALPNCRCFLILTSSSYLGEIAHCHVDVWSHFISETHLYQSHTTPGISLTLSTKKYYRWNHLWFTVREENIEWKKWGRERRRKRKIRKLSRVKCWHTIMCSKCKWLSAFCQYSFQYLLTLIDCIRVPPLHPSV